jgi:hypothetical protein
MDTFYRWNEDFIPGACNGSLFEKPAVLSRVTPVSFLPVLSLSDACQYAKEF